MLNKINNLKEIIQQILTSYPDTRDNDRLLMLKVWAFENPRLRDDPNFSFKQFGNVFKDGYYTDPESIRRTRQKIQESYYHLRGKNYKNRKNYSEEVRQEMRS